MRFKHLSIYDKRPENVGLNSPADRLSLELQVGLGTPPGPGAFPRLPSPGFPGDRDGPARPAALSVLETAAGTKIFLSA